MKKFGFGKKGGGGDERGGNEDDSANRSALFGSRSSKGKGTSPAPASSNPYAQHQQPDPYAHDTNKYAGMGQTYGKPRAGAGYGGGPPGGPPGGQGMNEGPPPGGNPGGYGRPGYSPDKYGTGAGYGEDRFGGRSGAGGPAPAPSGGSRYGPAGYGGLGGGLDNGGADDNRNELFGGAKDRYEQKARVPPGAAGGGGGGGGDGGYGQSGAYEDGGANANSGYGAYGEDRQLTAEEEEEEDVQATKQEIKFVKQQDVASTANALRVAAQAEETGRSTLSRLAAQGERIHNTEKNLDLASNHNRIAEERAKELKTLNKSMFAMHVSNPFTAASRRRERDDDILNKHHNERDQREATRAAAFDSRSRMDHAVRDIEGSAGRNYESAEKQKSRLAERSKYQFEADSEDDEMENEIDRNLDALSGAAGTLNSLARATGREVDEQNELIGKVTKKSDKVDDHLHMNRKRLDRIH